MTLRRFAHMCMCIRTRVRTYIQGINNKYLCEETPTEKKRKRVKEINGQPDSEHKRTNNRKVNKLQSKVFDTSFHIQISSKLNVMFCFCEHTAFVV